MIPGGVNPLLLSGGGHQLQRSLRFRSAATASLTRTPAGAGNRKLWTYSAWVKRGNIAGNGGLLSARVDANNYSALEFVGNELRYLQASGGTVTLNEKASALFRDPSAWFHVVAVLDTDNATAEDRFRLFVNGSRITAWAVSTNASAGLATGFINNTTTQNIGADSSLFYFDGYIADGHFIDGQALTQFSFGQFDSNGMWQAKPYAGTYGTNGFRLDFNDPTSTTTLMLDRSGSGNNWTASSISLTAGAAYDSMLDVPLGAGGQERGNYATLSPLYQGGGNAAFPASWSLTNGNLAINYTTSGGWGAGGSAFQMASGSGKWYWEVTPFSASGPDAIVGVHRVLTTSNFPYQILGTAGDVDGYGYLGSTGQKYNNEGAAYGATFAATSDVIGVAFDMSSAGSASLTFYKNGVSQGVAFSGMSGDFIAALATTSGNICSINFGQRPFTYTPPTGFKALHTGNLPAPAIANPKQHFDVVTATGANIKSTTEALFPGDFFEMLKDRANANNWQQIDSVRGASAVLQSNTTSAETTYVAPSGGSVGFAWKAGGAPVTNSAGSISAQVSANPAAGFSIVTYTGAGANATVGHGLGVAPRLIIQRPRNSVAQWPVYLTPLGNTNALLLNSTAASGSYPAMWNSTTPTSSVFSIGTDPTTNPSGINCVAYCFAEIPGFSKIGAYTGNGNADGPFVHCGFRPRYVMVKRTDTAGSWVMLDSVRELENPEDRAQFANLPDAETLLSSGGMDFTANGFKLRGTDPNLNTNGGTYIFIAFAEAPFNSSLAR